MVSRVPKPLLLAVAAFMLLPAAPLHAQASALPSANPDAGASAPDRGRKLLDQMVEALGGEKWLDRSTWIEFGQTAHFYKGQPDPYVVGLEEYHRAEPFAERVISVSHFSVIPGMPGSNYRDAATVWTPDNGYEITYKGKKPLPKDDVAEFQRLRLHSLDVIVKQWLKQPGVVVTYEGTDMVQRRLAQKVSVLNTANDTVEIALEESTHLPLSVTFRARNATYRDFDTETIEYSDWHDVEGIMTPMTITRYKNGEMASQRFLKKVEYNAPVSPELFDPDKPLALKNRKK